MFFPAEFSSMLARAVHALEMIAREMALAREAREKRDAPTR